MAYGKQTGGRSGPYGLFGGGGPFGTDTDAIQNNVQAVFPGAFSEPQGNGANLDSLFEFLAELTNGAVDLTGGRGQHGKENAAPVAKPSGPTGNFFDEMMGGTANGIAGILGQANQQAQAQPEPTDQLDALFATLMNSLGSGGQTFDYETALQDSEQAIRDAYRNDIHAIRGQNRHARKETAGQRQDLEQMYNALGRNYEKAGRNEARQGTRLANQMQRVSDRGANALQGDTNDILDDQAALAKGLGVEDALPDVLGDQRDQLQHQLKNIHTEGAEDANRQLAFSGNNRRFLNRGAQGARLEGTNRSADLLADLQDFVQGNRDKVASLRGARGHELAQNKSAVMGSVAEMQQQADQEMWDRLMDLAGVKMDIENSQSDQAFRTNELAQKAQQAQSGGGDAFPGAENFGNSQNYLSQLSNPRQGTNLFDQFLSGDEMREGRFQGSNGDLLKLTPYAAMDLISQMGQKQGLSPSDINLLRLAVFAQMGG